MVTLVLEVVTVVVLGTLTVQHKVMEVVTVFSYELEGVTVDPKVMEVGTVVF